MNEADRAAFAEADEELSALGVDSELMDKIEVLWIDGHRDNRRRAAELLRDAVKDRGLEWAYDLLTRAYDGTDPDGV